ncbi:hypothetical protein HYN59_09605 [Flavobacterium album]|uniref:Lipoprotein n=1 Tax=Flavobacterium album TaxID=2175091 RepID=A0A2S1QY71_9FLAO|nr:hypothetical protein [Flavobacterium album]AWH85353.1 hypothetical protein HYN59_09605 [Flavobacterium album]
MIRNFTQLFLIAATCLAVSCGKQECKNTNPVFDANTPDSKPYKAELTKQLAEAEKNSVKYWINSYKEVDGQQYMVVDITGNGFCATAQMAISPEDTKLQGFIKAKGKGYSGAELEGLQYGITSDSNGGHFIFKELGGVID